MQPPKEILADPTRLREWQESNPTASVEAHDLEAEEASFQGMDLEGANFTASKLPKADFRDANLRAANFSNARLVEADFRGAHAIEAKFNQAHITGGAKLAGIKAAGAHIASAVLTDAKAPGANFEGALLSSTELHRADLRKARIRGATLKGANLTGADLRGADLAETELTNTVWIEARLDSSTNLESSVWRPQHDSVNDGSDRIQLAGYLRAFNWSRVRFVSGIPLFSGAYLLLTGALVTATVIEWANQEPLISQLGFALTTPPRLDFLLIGSGILALGTTIYEFACPSEVKEYSRTRWVEELNRPGALYIYYELRRVVWAALSVLTVYLGAGILGGLFLERIWKALLFILR